MGQLILFCLIILIIWGIIKLIIFLVPFVAKSILIILGVGGAVGLLVGTFYSIKNYMLSIHENINNKAFKITMMIITSLFITIILTYLTAVVYFLSNYLN